MTKVQHERAPWRNPTRQRPADKIKAGLEDALAFAQGDTTRGRIADPPAVRPPPEHADKEWHWIATAQYPLGEPMRLYVGHWWSMTFHNATSPEHAAIDGWRWIAPCEPPA